MSLDEKRQVTESVSVFFFFLKLIVLSVPVKVKLTLLFFFEGPNNLHCVYLWQFDGSCYIWK